LSAEKKEDPELEKIRGYLRKAAEMKDPRDMFIAALSAVDLLWMRLNPVS
jgi:hypothetical protein